MLRNQLHALNLDLKNLKINNYWQSLDQYFQQSIGHFQLQFAHNSLQQQQGSYSCFVQVSGGVIPMNEPSKWPLVLLGCVIGITAAVLFILLLYPGTSLPSFYVDEQTFWLILFYAGMLPFLIYSTIFAAVFVFLLKRKIPAASTSTSTQMLIAFALVIAANFLLLILTGLINNFMSNDAYKLITFAVPVLFMVPLFILNTLAYFIFSRVRQSGFFNTFFLELMIGCLSWMCMALIVPYGYFLVRVTQLCFLSAA
jgi:hypothetical protein